MRAGVRNGLGVVLAFAALTAAMTLPLLFHLSDHVASDLRDPLYAMFVMTWNVRSAASGFAGFADANIFFPHRGTLFYADVLPVESILDAPVLAATGNPVLAYNIVFLITFLVSGLGMYALVRRLTGSGNAAFLAGIIFAFFPYHFAHSAHLEILFMGWIPLFFLYVHKFFDRPTAANALGMAGFYVLQVASCIYYGEYLTLFAALTFLYFIWTKRGWTSGRIWAGLAVFAAASAAVLGPYILQFLRIHARLLFVRSSWEAEFFSAEVQHFAAVPPFNAAWGWLTGRTRRPGMAALPRPRSDRSLGVLVLAAPPADRNRIPPRRGREKEAGLHHLGRGERGPHRLLHRPGTHERIHLGSRTGPDLLARSLQAALAPPPLACRPRPGGPPDAPST